METTQCIECGCSWSEHELEDGLCPVCSEEEYTLCADCPKCGRHYNEIDYGYRYCSKCGYDAETKKYTKPREPSAGDYINGDADILTGIWN